MNIYKAATYPSHFAHRRATRKQHLNPYPLLGIAMVILMAMLGYGLLYSLIFN
jgi:hypothetical protein